MGEESKKDYEKLYTELKIKYNSKCASLTRANNTISELKSEIDDLKKKNSVLFYKLNYSKTDTEFRPQGANIHHVKKRKSS